MAKEPYVISKEDRNLLRQIRSRHAISHRPYSARIDVAPDVLEYIEDHGLELSDLRDYCNNGRILISDVDRFLDQKRFFEKHLIRQKLEEEKLASVHLNKMTGDEKEDVLNDESSFSDEDKIISDSFDNAESAVRSEKNNEIDPIIVSATADEDSKASRKNEDATCDSKGDFILVADDVDNAENVEEKIISEAEDQQKLYDSILPDEDTTDSTGAERFDVIIIGCGMSGYHMAVQSARIGLKTAVIEKDLVGGKTLKDGLFPISYLKKNAILINECRKASGRGLIIKGLSLDLQCMMRDKARKIESYRQTLQDHMDQLGVTFFKGVGEIKSEGHVNVIMPDETAIDLVGKSVVLASGTTSRIPKQCRDIPYIFTDGQAHDLDRIPDAMAIIGTGPALCEYASFYCLMGSKVTIITNDDHVLPNLDHDVNETVERDLTASGVTIFKNAYIDGVYRDSLGDLHLDVCQSNTIQGLICSDICVIQERLPNLQCMKSYGLEHSEKKIAVDSHGKTAMENIYAIGSVTDNPTVTAMDVLNTVISQKSNPKQNKACRIRTVNMVQEIAVVGLTEMEAGRVGYEVTVNKMSINLNMRFFLEDCQKGFVKLVSDGKTGKVLGAVFCCDHAIELASAIQMFIQMDGSLDDLQRFLFHQPSYTAVLGDMTL